MPACIQCLGYTNNLPRKLVSPFYGKHPLLLLSDLFWSNRTNAFQNHSFTRDMNYAVKFIRRFELLQAVLCSCYSNVVNAGHHEATLIQQTKIRLFYLNTTKHWNTNTLESYPCADLTSLLANK